MKKPFYTKEQLEIIKYKMSLPGFKDHALPRTRREFIQWGLMTGAVATTFGGLSGFLTSSKAQAEEMPAKQMMPFLAIDCAGGAALHGNWLVGGKGGSKDLIKDYSSHGWNPRDNGALDETYGLPMSAKFSKILDSINRTVPQDQRQFLKFASICSQSNSDSSSNVHNILTSVTMAGLNGTITPNGLGVSPSPSGGNSASYRDIVALRPRQITSLNDIQNLTSISKTFDQMSADDKAFVEDFLLKEAEANGDRLMSTDKLAAELRVYGQPFNGGNYQNDRDALNIFRNSNSQERDVRASIVYNVINRNVGPGVIVVSGCDYHVGNQTAGDQKDQEIGQEIAMAVAYAAVKKSPLFLHIFTDGGITSDNARNWKADSNVHSLAVIGVFDPTGTVKQMKTQIGNFNQEGAVDQNTIVGSGADKQAYAALLNYLAANNAMDKIKMLTDRGGVTAEELAPYLAFQGA